MTTHIKRLVIIKLLAIKPGGAEACRRYRTSKFFKHRRDRDGMGWPRVGQGRTLIFNEYWREETICNFVGHRPAPVEKCGHLPRCRICHWIIGSWGTLADGEVMPVGPQHTEDCWHTKVSKAMGWSLVIRPKEVPDEAQASAGPQPKRDSDRPAETDVLR